LRLKSIEEPGNLCTLVTFDFGVERMIPFSLSINKSLNLGFFAFFKKN